MKAATKAEGTRPRFTFSVKRLNAKKGRPLIASGLEGPDLKQSGGGLRSKTFSTLKKTLMHTTTYPRENHSLLGLIGGLREDVRNLFHEEVQLAKTELSEKASHFGRNAVYLAIGGAVGYLAINLIFVSLAFIIGYAFETLGLSTGVALFLGFMAMGILMAAVGGIFAAKALSGFKKETLVPEKTIQTLRVIKEGGLEQAPVKTPTTPTLPKNHQPDRRSSAQIRTEVDETRQRIGREVRSLKTQLNVARVAGMAVSRFSRSPVKSVGIGIGTTVAGFFLMRMARLFGRRHAA